MKVKSVIQNGKRKIFISNVFTGEDKTKEAAEYVLKGESK